MLFIINATISHCIFHSCSVCCGVRWITMFIVFIMFATLTLLNVTMKCNLYTYATYLHFFPSQQCNSDPCATLFSVKYGSLTKNLNLVIIYPLKFFVQWKTKYFSKQFSDWSFKKDTRHKLVLYFWSDSFKKLFCLRQKFKLSWILIFNKSADPVHKTDSLQTGLIWFLKLQPYSNCKCFSWGWLLK